MDEWISCDLSLSPSLSPQAQAGKAVNVDDLPPPVSTGGGPEAPKATTAVSADQQELSDEELMAWAGNSERGREGGREGGREEE